jgi:Glycosyl transferase family 2
MSDGMPSTGVDRSCSTPTGGVPRSKPIPAARVVAVPIAFNEELKIGRVLDRFEGVAGIEVAVVDDGSTDGTPEIVRRKRAGWG